MPAARRQRKQRKVATPAEVGSPGQSTSRAVETKSEDRLAGLSSLAGTEIETSLVAELSGQLHAIFDPVSDGVLPIYFGPLLGRLYLEGL
jgi:hypothetical protein